MARGLSERQIMRRATILSRARELMEERGYDGVTMRDLAERSSVALKTLYDIYGSKDVLLAKAIEERARLVFEGLDRDTGKIGFDRLMMIVERQWRGALEVPNLTKSVAPILSAQPGAFTIENAYMRYHRRAVQEIADAGELAPWADVDFLVRLMLVDQGPITILWSRDEISSEQLLDFTVMMMCQVLYPAVLGATREAIGRTLEDTYIRLRSWRIG
ncbi:MAG: TetR/AcrR family transcriptional regulator [Sphingomonadales bacterium]